MQKFGPWDLPGFDYFTAKNAFIGSKDELRFKVAKNEDNFTVFVWYGEKCFEKSDIEIEESFPFNEDSLYEINEFLTKTYKNKKTQG